MFIEDTRLMYDFLCVKKVFIAISITINTTQFPLERYMQDADTQWCTERKRAKRNYCIQNTSFYLTWLVDTNNENDDQSYIRDSITKTKCANEGMNALFTRMHDMHSSKSSKSIGESDFAFSMFI